MAYSFAASQKWQNASDMFRLQPSSAKATGDTASLFNSYAQGLLSSTGANIERTEKFNAEQAALNREFQHNEAQIERDWYEAMSNSAYQRAVADMKSAGINPVLAYAQGGAASAATGIASGSAASNNTVTGDTLVGVLGAVANLISSVKGSGKKITNFYNVL